MDGLPMSMPMLTLTLFSSDESPTRRSDNMVRPTVHPYLAIFFAVLVVLTSSLKAGRDAWVQVQPEESYA